MNFVQDSYLNILWITSAKIFYKETSAKMQTTPT